MRDIQEIIEEMNNLSEQIAVSLNEGNTDTAVAPTQVVSCADCSGTGGASECATPSRTVTFTCRLSAPEGFRFATGAEPRILYDLSYLHCFVEQCICVAAGNELRYAVRIVGSIPYIINARVRTAGLCSSDGNIFLCCPGSVCVDNTICFGCTEVPALVSCELIRRDLTCTGISVALTPVFEDSGTLAIISGTFTLPECNGNGVAVATTVE